MPERAEAVELSAEGGADAARAAFQLDVAEATDRLYALALRLTRNRADAEDLVADAVMRAWHGYAGLKERGHFAPWIRRILVNTFISDRRRLAAGPAQADLPADGDAFSLFERLHQPFLLWWGTPEQELLNKLLRHDLARALDRLPTAFRIAVVLVDVEGLSYQEVAEATGVPVGTVRSRLARGRGLLQCALWDHARDAGLVPANGAGKEAK
jgi:RNA polymerase sigma-70 factor (ECF subfamily)